MARIFHTVMMAKLFRQKASRRPQKIDLKAAAAKRLHFAHGCSRHPCYDLQKSLLRRRSMSITQLHDLSTPLRLLVTDSLRLLHFINLGGLYTFFHRNGNGGLKKWKWFSHFMDLSSCSSISPNSFLRAHRGWSRHLQSLAIHTALSRMFMRLAW